MKIGDPKRASLLGIVAIGAVGFLVVQLLPAPGQSGPTSSIASEDGIGKKTVDAFPVALTTDPFSNSALAKVQGANAATTTPPETGTKPQTLPKLIKSRLGQFEENGDSWAPPLIPGTFPSGLAPDVGQKPVNNTGQDRQSNLETSVSVQVQAVLIVNERKAYISIQGAAAKAFKAGDQISKGLKLESVNDEGVILVRKGKSFRVPVGGSRDI